MFFLFFGTRQRSQVLGTGTFHCPYCTVPRTYEHRSSRTWGHVFWVPLFPLGGELESVRCTACGGEWDPAVLVTTNPAPYAPQDGPQDDPRHGWPSPQDS